MHRQLSFPSRLSRTRGQSMAEFAIVLPFLVLVVAGLVDFGFYLYDFIGVHAGIRDGALAAVHAQSDGTPFYSYAQIQTIVQLGHGSVAQIQPGEVTLSPWPPPAGNPSFTLSVDHTHPFLLPVYGRNSSIQIHSGIKTFCVKGFSP